MSSSISNPVFTPDVLDSYRCFCNFFNQNETVEQIKAEADKPHSKNLLNKWQVTILSCTAPLRRVYVVFLEAVRKVLFYMGLNAWALQLHVHKRLWEKDKRQETWETFGSDCLAFSVNARAQDSSDVYLQPKIPVDDIRSSRVRDLVNPKLKQLDFYKKNGVCCRGMSEWFFYLYFQTKDYFDDPNAHMQAIGRQFSNGAPRQAGVLQALASPNNREFLGLQTERTEVLPSSAHEETDRRSLIEMFKELEPGAYAIHLHKHRLNYISVSRKRGYLYDPSQGTISIKGSRGIAKLAREILDYVPAKIIDFTEDGQPVLTALEKLVPEEMA